MPKVCDLGKNYAHYATPRGLFEEPTVAEVSAMIKAIADRRKAEIKRFRVVAALHPCPVCGTVTEISDYGNVIFICQHVFERLTSNTPNADHPAVFRSIRVCVKYRLS